MVCCLGEVKFGPAKWIYFAGLVATAILTWVLRDYGHTILRHASGFSDCLQGPASDVDNCMGKGAVLRISFGNFLFFAAHALVLIGVKQDTDPRRLLHSGCWALQLLLWAALIGVTFALPNGVFYVYGQIARVLSGFFLIFVIVVILDWVYLVNEWLLKKDVTWSRICLIAGSFIFYAGSLVGIGFLFHYYAPSASCGKNIFFIVFTLLGMLVYSGISLSPWRVKQAGLLTSGAVFAYCTFLLYSALASEPPNACVVTASGNRGLQATGFFLAIAMVLFSTIDAGVQSRAFDLEKGDAVDPADLPYRPDFFHLIFALASCYLAMVFTDWSLSDVPGQLSTGQSWVSTWIKIACSWIVMALYTFSLLAPRILRNREFL